MDEIPPVQALYTSCKKELSRLKCMLAARPPPGYKAPVVLGKSKPCINACCSLGFYPPPDASPRLRYVVLQLQLVSQELSQYLGAKRSLAAPIRRLPPELLQDVFLFTVISDTYALAASSNFQKAVTLRKAVGAIRLAHVCSYWRAVALDTGQLWATILLRLSHSGITQLNFYTAHAKSTPLTIICRQWAQRQLLTKLVCQSHCWRSLTLRVPDMRGLDVIHQRIPMLRSLCLHTCMLNARATTNVFRAAPSLRRVTLTADILPFEPFALILPWSQLTFLTLQPLSLSLFSQFVRECPQLLYFNVRLNWETYGLNWQTHEDPLQVARTTETHSSLRKLVLRGAKCQEVVISHSFPHLLSLSIQTHVLSPDFFRFLARSSHLEMLSVLGWNFKNRHDVVAYCSRPPVELLLATPCLRIMHVRTKNKDWNTAMVTPRFYDTPLVVPL
ncbi:hypothetical protein B0H12DRAFT_1234908 [Mycena haematopus]|nr:hypothetical protein B0H12DRAFT_1234908 [Mycena haematopus]